MPKLTISQEATFFKDQGFNIWNVNDEKRPSRYPITSTSGIQGWQHFVEEDFKILKVDYTKNIGFLSGYQWKSKRDILVMDFDMYSKGIINNSVVQLYDKFLSIDLIENKYKKGHYNSSTCGNKGVIIDYTDKTDFKKFLCDLERTKIGDGLEILIKGNVVLPPSTTNCKNCQGQAIHPRKFMEEISINTLTPQTEAFIMEYINSFRTKIPNKNEIRDTRNAKNGVIHYTNIITESDDSTKPSYKCMLELINKILKNSLNDYHGWFFITASLINSYGNSEDNFILYDEICKNTIGYNSEENKKFWITAKTNKYATYNYKAIIKNANFYNPLIAYCILGEEYKRFKLEVEKNKLDSEYKEWKDVFELTHAKIISPLNFLDVIDGVSDFISQVELKQRYAEKSKFIDMWLKDETKRSYKKIIFKPNANEEENKNYYNLFKGYRIENIDSPSYTIDIIPLLQFINLISGNKNYKILDFSNVSFKLVMAFIIKIVKYKERPKISLILRSVRRQGCGKGTFYSLVKALLGSEYCLETSIIDDLFGNFNDGRVNKIFIAIDECAGTETFQLTGKLKNAITESSFIANPKYGKRYELENYNSFVFYSNNERCVQVEIGNRRFWVIDVPNATDSKFLIDINTKYINNNAIICAFYDYLINKAEEEFKIDVSNFNFEEIIRNHENQSTKNLKQTHTKDLFLIHFYKNVINEKNELSDILQDADGNKINYTPLVIYNDTQTYAMIKANLFYEKYKDFYNKSNISKDGGNCGSNQSFYKSLEFYEFLQAKRNTKNEYYLITIEKYKSWFESQEEDSNFEIINDDELKKLGFS
jgi:hypothetical protein